MHLFDAERRFMGGYGIVGGNLPLAAGVALASDYRGEDAVTVCMFGDGASNQGTFGETMNLAALWKLPVVFMVVNNQYGMGTALSRHSAVTDLSSEGRVPRRARRARRRHGRARGARVRRRAPAPGARGPPAHAGRGAHLPLPRSLGRRPRGLPDQGGGAAVARARSDPGSSRSVCKEAGFLDEEGFEERDRKAIEIVDEAVAVRGRRAPTRRSSRSTTTSTCSATRSRAGTRWTSARPRCTAARTSARSAQTGVAHELAEAGAAYAGAGDVQRRRRDEAGTDGQGPADEAQEDAD